MLSYTGDGPRRVLWLALAALASWGSGCTDRADAGSSNDDPQDASLQWPLPPGAERYADIDGRRMLEHVVEQAEIARRYRDEVHPKYWGRIIGSSADAESARWLEGKFNEIGLADVRVQPVDLPPQWFPGTYQVTITSGNRTIELTSAQPFFHSVGTPPEGLELEAVYVGLGSEADYAGRDVQGKAVFTYGMVELPSRVGDALERAESKGAAAIFDVHMIAGNMRYQAYPPGTDVPTFSLGSDDGATVREFVESAAAGQPATVRVALDVEMVPNLQTGIVWGTLPGATDETVYIMGHRDGFFDAAGDNASGVATVIELARHFASIPQTERRRTIHFLGIDGHHNSTLGPDGRHVGGISGAGRNWMVENREQLFVKTALVINAEHPSTIQSRIGRGNDARLYPTTTYTGQEWYAGGPIRPELQQIAVNAFRQFGVATLIDPNPQPPGGDLGRFYTFLPGVATSDFYHYFHTDGETPETVPWTGLEASARAYAKIVDDVNRLDLGVLQKPEVPAPSDDAGPGTPIMTADVQDEFLPWPLPPGAEVYADIDGRRMLEDVVAQSEISRRYRDEVNSQLWGRIIGSSSDTESAEWLRRRFQAIGLSDVRLQSFDLAPQWFARRFRVTISSEGRTLELESALPVYRSVGAPPGGFEAEAVYVGLGSEADFAGRDVEGKAVFVYSMREAPSRVGDPMERAGLRGAAAVFEVHMMPGNMGYMSYPENTGVPTFNVGGDDGFAVREMIESASPGRPVRVGIQLDVEMVPDLRTAFVWGTLPGASDETIYVIAHRDGWFDAAGDNASGVASMIALAEHYAKVPRAERPRTIHFIGFDGHHNTGEGSSAGRRWMIENRAELFANTALMINAEHPSTVQTRIKGSRLVWTNTYTAQEWYAGGPSRPELRRIAWDAFREFGVSLRVEPNPMPPAGDLSGLYPYVPGVATSDFYHYFHTDAETPETVPWTGLEGSTRAYARIIDEVNELPLSALQRPEETVVE